MSPPPSLPPLVLLLVSTCLRLAAADPSLTDDSHCGCYLTNGTTTGYFTQHKFFDFRNLAQHQGVPAPLTDPAASAAAPPTSSYFTTPDWTGAWTVQSWNNSGGARSDASVLMVNSPNNVYIQQNTDPDPSSKTFLTLRTARLPDFQTAAELESASAAYHFLSVRMLARTLGAPGAVTAVFTYRGSKSNNSGGGAGGGAAAAADDVQEADLEVRTRDPDGVVHYTNQPSVSAAGDVVPAATVNATLPAGLAWGRWAVHRLDWTPGRSTWFADGLQTASIGFQAPRDPAQVILNSWSDGGQWTGNMSVGGEVLFQIQWLEMVYNASSAADDAKRRRRWWWGGLLAPREEAGCKAVCSVDETPKTGTPVMLWNSGAAGERRRPAAAAVAVPVVVGLAVALGSFW